MVRGMVEGRKRYWSEEVKELELISLSKWC